MMGYPIEFEFEEDGVLLTFPDIQGAFTDGDTKEEARSHALGALIAILDEYMARGKDIPPPSAPKGRDVVTLPTRIAMKVALYSEMKALKVSQAELARRLGIDPRQIRRMLDLTQEGLRPDDFDAAFAALGKAPTFMVRELA